MGSQPIRIQLGKILREILAGKSCRKCLWKNLVPNVCEKILQEILTGKRGKSQFKKGSDWWKFSIWNRIMGSQPIKIQLRKILRKNLVGKSCGKCLQENLARNVCGKCLQENLAGNVCRKILQEMFAGKSCGKFLWENLAGNLVGKSCGKCCGKFPIPMSKPFL